jgi:predicted CXXCH cytochrome family protein
MRHKFYLAVSALWCLSLVTAALHSQAQPPPSPVTPAGPLRLTANPPRITTPQQAAAAPNLQGRYVGSLACQRCHATTYERWSHTRMANVVTDPKVNPSVVIPDFSKPDPLVTFKLSDVAFVYGTKWKQRYFIRGGDDYYPAPAQWDILNRVWRPYFVAPNTDWWGVHYPATQGDNTKRPTGPLCDGCHSVNYNVQTRQPTEWNVGCEKCHGPGSEHVARPARTNIINPVHLDFVRANDTCLQCHTQGQPLSNPIGGQYFDWPVGFHQGLELKNFWKLEEHKAGEATFTHFAEGTAHKNRMQANDFVDSVMYRRGVTCFSCHDVHGTGNNADLLKPVGQICLTCHGPSSPNGPHAASSVEAHTHHAAGSAGSQCVECHMPKIEQTIANVNVRSHSFKFITPAQTDLYKIPNPCITCHTTQTNEWAKDQLKNWTGVSPWRMQ